MKNYMVTYIDPFVSTTEKQSDIWSADLLITESGKGEVTILEIYDPDTDTAWAWEN
jgi:hypothetical protein